MATRKPKEEPTVKKTRTVKTAEKATVKETVRKPRAKKEPVVAKNKEEATKLKQPWVGVLDTHVNPENPSNGFFELDWNPYFIVLLKNHGYDGPSEEAIVDAWFQNLCRNIGNEEGLDMDRRGSGYINVQKIGNNKSEVS